MIGPFFSSARKAAFNALAQDATITASFIMVGGIGSIPYETSRCAVSSTPSSTLSSAEKPGCAFSSPTRLPPARSQATNQLYVWPRSCLPSGEYCRANISQLWLTVSGTSSTLDANALPNGVVTKVDYRLSGGPLGYSNLLIGTASSTIYGWIRYDKGAAIVGMLPDTGAARGFDFYGIANFVGEIPWAHLDIAGTAWTEGSWAVTPPYLQKDLGTGVGVRLLSYFAKSWA